MSSTSFDGEFTARMIRRFGFVPVRGSSSRGAVRGLLGMRKEIEAGYTVAFTIDGPRGPRFVTKPGPVLLARSSKVPVAVFHIAIDRALDFEYVGPPAGAETVLASVDARRQPDRGAGGYAVGAVGALQWVAAIVPGSE